MNLLIECVIIEKEDDVKEAMFDGLRSMVGNNDSASINKQLEILINKLQVLEDRDLSESLLVISNTFDIRYLDLIICWSLLCNNNLFLVAVEREMFFHAAEDFKVLCLNILNAKSSFSD